MIRTTIFLPIQLHKSLKVLALRHKTSMTQLIQKALQESYFKKKQKTAKDLWGIAKNTHISFEEFKAIKANLKCMML